MIIELEDINNSQHGQFKLAGRPRLATCTSVQFVDHRRLLTVSLVGQRMYLMSFDRTTEDYRVESSIPTQFAGEPACTDLVDFDGQDKIVTSNSDRDSASLYRLNGDELSFDKDIPINDPNRGFCHGVCIVPPDSKHVCVTTTKNGNYLYFISLETDEVVYKFNDENWKAQDICFIDNRLMAAIYVNGSPALGDRPRHDAKLSLIELGDDLKSHKVICETIISECHIDCVQYVDGKLIFTDQLNDKLRIYRVGRSGFLPDREIGGFSFPHGLDVLDGEDCLMAVTNYGNNTIKLLPM